MQVAHQQQFQQNLHTQPPIRPDSPPSNMLNHTHISLKPNSDSIFAMQNPQHYGDYMLDPDKQNKTNGNGYASGPYRSSASFAPFSNNNRQRTNTAPGPFRDTTPSVFYPTASDVFGNASQSQHVTSPTQQQHPFDVLRGFEFPNGQASSKPPFGIVDPFGNGPSTGMLHQSNKPAQPYPSSTSQTFTNGQQQLHIQSQTPYGPHLQTNGAPVSVNGANGNATPQQQNNPAQEEISTIFVVGFPDDMQEREFQNMFTFSLGFEAATLKIPNKEYTAYGGGAGPSGRPGPVGLSYSQSYGGSNDPYNLVTVNQGGVVVDGGRDGTTASWPASVPGLSQDDGTHFAGSQAALPPRKQIIGFAKFRSRSEALDARDMLQGRRVDIEKGAVLKAEMAKKNLHTKRGVGPLGVGPGGAVAPGGPGDLAGLAMSAGLASAGIVSGGGELSARERELGALGAMGFGSMGQWRENRGGIERDEEAELRRRESAALSGLTRGPRERAEEEERERRRREKDARLRSTNTHAFDAFHSVPPQAISRHPSNSLLAASSSGSQQLSNGGFDQDEAVGPWDGNGISARKMSSAILPQRPTSASPPFSPTPSNPALPSHPSLPTRPRPQSPVAGEQVHAGAGSSSSASSVAGGSQSSAGIPDSGDALGGGLAVSTAPRPPGNTSPQLPSPASGASSAGARNPIDQNPPINTLYVGNLPTSQVPAGYPLNYLEESLRELFHLRPGFRKLCFRHKSNGPMCFVEFEDVALATRALNDLYGNTLNGLIKGGIRLSYSKNPLGVRTPTSGGSGPSLQQQQQQQAQSAGQQPVNAGGAFPPLSVDTAADSTRSRAELSAAISPPGSFNYMMSPPPRFVSPIPSSSGPFGNNAPRSYGSFSPFGMSTPPPPSSISIPDHQSAEQQLNYSHHRALSPPSASNLEAARAG